jgi:arylsulfatase A-like enzyme
MNPLRHLLLLATLASAPATPAAAAPAELRPNIIFILADDLGYGDLGCYGQQRLATPHIDRLAREGMRFTRHYAGNTVCTPSRSSTLTGIHPGRARHRDNPRFVNSYGFRPEDVTFAEVLRAAGYATALTGKWHLGDRNDTTDMAHHHGFDVYYGTGYPYPDGGIEHWPSHVFRNGVRTAVPENAGGRRARYMDDLYTDAALEFMRERRDRPFLLFLAFQGVHAPMDGAISETYAGKDWPAVEQTFASMLEKVDTNVGRVLQALVQLGLDARTVVFFSSDNGPHAEGGHSAAFFGSSGQLRGSKRDLTEGGLRVPLIVRWPGVVAAHSISHHVSASWDLLPTFAALAAAPAPAGIDGISILPTLKGAPQPTHPFLYWETRDGGGQQAVLEGPWKAIRGRLLREDSGAWRLYNLDSDPAELHDLAAAHPAHVARLARHAAASHVPDPRAPLFRAAPSK